MPESCWIFVLPSVNDLLSRYSTVMVPADRTRESGRQSAQGVFIGWLAEIQACMDVI